jgi:hypothetical protein
MKNPKGQILVQKQVILASFMLILSILALATFSHSDSSQNLPPNCPLGLVECPKKNSVTVIGCMC